MQFGELNILGISAFYHDSAASIIRNNEIIAAAQEERFTRIKHDPSFPSQAIKFCLEYGALEIEDLDAIVFYDKPLLKFERLLETYYSFAPKGVRSFIHAIPVWIKEKMFLKKLIWDELNKIQPINKKPKLLFTEHHLSHAASAFYPSAFKSSAILTLDGVGEWATASICKGEGKDITILKELKFPHSLGLLYSAFTYFLGFKVNSGEYKLMGLAPYGDPNSPQLKDFVGIIKNEMVEIKDDGSIWLNQKYFDYATGLKMTHNRKWEKVFGISRRNPETPLENAHCNLALAIQQITEEVVLKMAQEAKRLTGLENLCLAGGVGLNCVANGKLLESGTFKNIFIQPAAGDAGGAVGGALAAYHIYFDQERKIDNYTDAMKGAYLGPGVSNRDIERLIRKYKAHYLHFDDIDKLCDHVAKLIDQGHIIGWVQGRMEFGPRALGARSIIADPRNRDIQRKLNLKIKYRESFRPFAPSVLAEEVHHYFLNTTASPYMLLVSPLLEKKRNKLPENYNELPLRDKMYFSRSDLPAITHIDFSARVQTVHRETNERYWKLISAFKKVTGYSVIVNTSFNVRGEPIVCTPEDAYRCFMRTEMDYLVVGDFLFPKKDQPPFEEEREWKEEYLLD